MELTHAFMQATFYCMRLFFPSSAHAKLAQVAE